MLKNGFRQQEVRVKALPIANVPTVLLIRKQKYICPSMPDCPKVVTKLAEIDGIDRNCRITNNIKQAVILDLPKNESQKDIAQDHQVLIALITTLRPLLIGYNGRLLSMILSLVASRLVE